MVPDLADDAGQRADPQRLVTRNGKWPPVCRVMRARTGSFAVLPDPLDFSTRLSRGDVKGAVTCPQFAIEEFGEDKIQTVVRGWASELAGQRHGSRLEPWFLADLDRKAQDDIQ